MRTKAELILQGKFTTVNLGGKIDRIELGDDGTLYVMDYKTGSVKVSVKKLNDPLTQAETMRTVGDSSMGYVRQLWLYEYLMYRKMQVDGGLKIGDTNYEFGEHLVRSGFYSFRTPTDMIQNPLELADGNQPLDYIAKSEEILTDVLNNLLDPDITVSQNQRFDNLYFLRF